MFLFLKADLCIDFEEIEEDDELKTEYPCPYCSEDFDLLGLCCHIDEEHHLEANYGVRTSLLNFLSGIKVCCFWKIFRIDI